MNLYNLLHINVNAWFACFFPYTKQAPFFEIAIVVHVQTKNIVDCNSTISVQLKLNGRSERVCAHFTQNTKRYQTDVKDGPRKVGVPVAENFKRC